MSFLVLHGTSGLTLHHLCEVSCINHIVAPNLLSFESAGANELLHPQGANAQPFSRLLG